MRTAPLAGALAIREGMRVPDTTEKASSEGIVAELAHLYSGRRLSLAEIGSRYGHTADWVKARLVSAGVQIRSQGRQPAEVTPDQVRALLDQGLRVPQIADRLGVSETTVQKIIREQGAHRGDHADQPGMRHPTLRRGLCGGYMSSKASASPRSLNDWASRGAE